LFAQADDFQHFSAGLRLGVANNILVIDGSNEAEIDNAGVIGAYQFGYDFNQHWGLELGVLAIQDIGSTFLVELDDIDVSGSYLAGTYSHKLGESNFYLRARGGVLRWDAYAEERFTLFGIDLVPGEGESYDKKGQSMILGGEILYRTARYFEFIILGYDTISGGNVRWNSTSSGIRLRF